MPAKQLAHFGGIASAGIVLGGSVLMVLTRRAGSRDTCFASYATAVMLAQHCRVTQP